MSTLNTPEYYRRRERQERELAAKALLPDIRAIHEDLADRYRALIDSADAPPVRPRLHLAIAR